MLELLEKLNARCGWDCVVKSYDGWRLCISSGLSVDYATPLAIFSGVSYLSCPMEFSHPRFRLASTNERKLVGRLVFLDEYDNVVAIEGETAANADPQVYFIVAQSGDLA